MFSITNININTDYKNKEGVIVATGYATMTDSIEIHMSIKDRVGYEADKESIDAQEVSFRKGLLQIADIAGVATPTVKPEEPNVTENK